MRKIIAFQLADGSTHNTLNDAQRAAGAKHADALSALARSMSNETGSRYFPSTTWLMENRQAIEAMYSLHDDIAVVADDEED